jgi:hypothetical protein
MIRTLGISLAIALACGSSSATRVEDRRPLRLSHDRYDLPLNPGAPVIEFTQWRPPKRSECLVPDLTILADGTILASCGTCEYIPSFSPGYGVRHLHDRRASRIDPEALQKLLHFILVENKLASWDSEKVKTGVEQAWRDQPPEIRRILSRLPLLHEVCVSVHVNRTVTTVHWVGSRSEFNGLHAEALRGLIAVRDRLESMRLVTVAGGPEAVTKWLTLANASLRSEYPAAESFERTDLSWARMYMEPSDLEVRFLHVSYEKGRALIEAEATLRIEEGKPPNVSVTLERHRL